MVSEGWASYPVCGAFLNHPKTEPVSEAAHLREVDCRNCRNTNAFRKLASDLDYPAPSPVEYEETPEDDVSYPDDTGYLDRLEASVQRLKEEKESLARALEAVTANEITADKEEVFAVSLVLSKGNGDFRLIQDIIRAKSEDEARGFSIARHMKDTAEHLAASISAPVN